MTREEMKMVIKGMIPFDDPLFNRIFKDNIPGMTLLLKACLGRDDIKVLSSKTQVMEEGLGYHSVVYDALAVDSTGRLFNVEIQKDPRGASIKRARFNASSLDMQALNKGEDHDLIRDTYVIMITTKDYWKCGHDCVTFKLYSEELGRCVEDGRHIVYINGAATGDSFLASVMRDMRCADVSKMRYNEIAERTRALKNTEVEVDMIAMTYDESLRIEREKGIDIGRKQGIEQGIDQGIEKGKAMTNLEIARKLKYEKLTPEFISKVTGLSVQQIEGL